MKSSKKIALLIAALLFWYAWSVHTNSWSALQTGLNGCSNYNRSDSSLALDCSNTYFQDYGEQQWLMWISITLGAALVLYGLSDDLITKRKYPLQAK
jgi:hypothetical protein